MIRYIFGRLVMKIRIAVLLLAFLLPIKADALFIFDIGSTPAAVANTITDAGRVATDVKKAKTFWKTLKSIGDGIKAVADFYSKAKAWVKVRYDKYVMYRDSVKRFIDQTEKFYASVMDAYEAVLNAAEYAAEIGQRLKAYLQEGKDIISYAKESLNFCNETAKYMVNFKQQWEEQSEIYKQNKENTDARIAQLEQEIADLQEQGTSGFNVENIRNKREQLAVARAEAETYKQYLRNIENQVFNYNRQMVNMVNDCRYRIQVTAARTQRLICNVSTGALAQYASKLDGITGQISNITNSLNGMNTEIEYQQQLSEKVNGESCARLKSECYNGFGGVSAEAIAESEAKRQESCETYQNNCAQTVTQEVVVIPSLTAGVPSCEEVVRNIKATVTKKVDCTLAKAQCMAQEDSAKREEGCNIYCENCGTIEGVCGSSSSDGGSNSDVISEYQNNCHRWKQSCEVLKLTMPDYDKMPDCVAYKEYNCEQSDTNNEPSKPSAQQFGALYSIHNSLDIAQAAIELPDMSSVTQTPTDTPEGEFIQSADIANICQIDSLDKINELAECFGKFNTVKSAQTETDIPEDMIEFYKALRGTKTANGKKDETFYSKHQANDSKTANRYMNDSYAEYLASSYFRGLNFYKKYFMYDIDVINPMQTSVGSDVGTGWASVSLVEQEISELIYDIYTMWSKEQLTGAIEGIVNYQISQEGMIEASKNDPRTGESSNE